MAYFSTLGAAAVAALVKRLGERTQGMAETRILQRNMLQTWYLWSQAQWSIQFLLPACPGSRYLGRKKRYSGDIGGKWKSQG